MRSAIAIGIVVSLAALWWASGARAQALGPYDPARIELGPDAAVSRTYVPCWNWAGGVCPLWAPEGQLSFGGLDELPYATTFARAANGRIVAMIRAILPYYGTGATYPSGSMLLYTDDLGDTWSTADWPDPALFAVAIAFDPAGPTGIAVGGEGSVWSSEDHGLTWRRRRSATGSGFRRVWVRGRTCVVEDATGALWLSHDRGFALESLADRGATVEERGGELVVRERDRATRVDARGSVHRE